jgi:nitrogen fixation protein NifB
LTRKECAGGTVLASPVLNRHEDRMSTVISIAAGSIKRVGVQPPAAQGTAAGGCSSSGAAGKTGCGSSAGADALAPGVWEKVRNHPCYSEEAHHHYARMHIAVAPACNIQCHYCNRKYDCANESRPGVVSERLSPEQGAKKVLAVEARIPQMSVVGIAGPGDPLANPARTFRTFELIAAQAPDIKLCLSTNGLALPRWIDEIARLNVDHVTITINAVDPEVGARIYPWIFFDHRRWTGIDAARILLEQQMRGLELLRERGILAKINSVLIPGINDRHLVEVNREVKARGAFLHNIMPLISAPEHGTVFGLRGQRGPSAAELKAVQDACDGGANLMRHCRQCRADAVGMLGEDRSDEFTLAQLDAMPEVEYDLAARRAYQQQVEAERAAQRAAKEAAFSPLLATGAATAAVATPSAGAVGTAPALLPPIKVLVAVASKGGGRVNEHFGHASEFKVYEVGAQGATFIGHRRVDHYCQGGYGDDDEVLPTVIRALADCHAVLVSKIGRCPKDELAAAGIEPVEEHAFEFIEAALAAWFSGYAQRVARGEIEHRPRGDAQLRQGALVGESRAA